MDLAKANLKLANTTNYLSGQVISSI
ncbi:hypothetical protein VTH82DRAFT_6910 [Thermothelomyces myriococcoides]